MAFFSPASTRLRRRAVFSGTRNLPSLPSQMAEPAKAKKAKDRQCPNGHGVAKFCTLRCAGPKTGQACGGSICFGCDRRKRSCKCGAPAASASTKSPLPSSKAMAALKATLASTWRVPETQPDLSSSSSPTPQGAAEAQSKDGGSDVDVAGRSDAGVVEFDDSWQGTVALNEQNVRKLKKKLKRVNKKVSRLEGLVEGLIARVLTLEESKDGGGLGWEVSQIVAEEDKRGKRPATDKKLQHQHPSKKARRETGRKEEEEAAEKQKKEEEAANEAEKKAREEAEEDADAAQRRRGEPVFRVDPVSGRVVAYHKSKVRSPLHRFPPSLAFLPSFLNLCFPHPLQAAACRSLGIKKGSVGNINKCVKGELQSTGSGKNRWKWAQVELGNSSGIGRTSYVSRKTNGWAEIVHDFRTHCSFHYEL